MADDRYNRWQGLGIAQLSVAVALISGLSVAGLGVGLSLLQKNEFLLTAPKCVFVVSLLLLLIAALLSCGAVITRLLDFRLTARKVRKDMKPNYDKPLTIFWLGPDGYGRATWGLFWGSCLTFLVGVVLLVVSIGVAYADRLH
jgi:ABC-type dipeptide/oligopeptide/nickel transport system permease subunit